MTDNAINELLRHVLAQYADNARIVAYGELYDRIAPQVGWPPRRQGRQGQGWARRLASHLGQLADLAVALDEPLLSSLVRYADEGVPVGAGFLNVVQKRYGFTPVDVQRFAEVEAGKCHRFFGPVR